MIAVDTNLLVYAHRQDSEWHEEALAVLLELAQGGTRWAIPWPCAHEFVAIVTHLRIYTPPTPVTLACKAIASWAESPSLTFIGESEGYWDRFTALASKVKLQGGAAHDGRVAAICLHHGVKELWSADRDFSRFATLKVRNPLTAD